jgi:hypothetical protein
VRIGVGPAIRDYMIREEADGIGVYLGEPQGQITSWQLDIFAITKIGRFMVGTFFTVPASVGAAVGGAPDRLIGYAYAPGARAWAIRATGPNPTGGDVSRGPLVSTNVSADLKAAPVHCFGAGVGVFYAKGRIIETGGPLAVSRVDAVTPARLATITANAPGTNVVERWLMLFDSAVVPGAGTPPYFKTVPLDLAPGATGQETFEPALFFTNGISWGLSSTPDVFTPVPPGGDTVRVVTAQEW